MENVRGTKSKSLVIMRSLFALIFAFVIFIAIDRAAIYLADLLAAGGFKYTWLMVHHGIQIVIALMIMMLPLWHKSISDWGINLRNRKKTLNILLKFTIGWVIGATIFTLVSQWLSGWAYPLDFYFNTENALIYLVFEFIVVGISEEIVFRGLVYGILRKVFAKKVTIFGFPLSIASIISALFFAIAHVGFQFNPFMITIFAPMQVFIAFVLGLFYAALIENTGSLLGPILAHNISDGWLSILYILIQMVIISS